MDWYQKEIEEIYQELSSTEDGLCEQKILENRKLYGYNELPHEKKKSFFSIFLSEFKDPIVLLLLVTIVFSFLIGEVVDALAIAFIVIVDVLMGSIQEWKAILNAESLSNMIQVHVKVIREGKEIQIDSRELLPGDIVLLESGDKVSADMRILKCSNLQLDEAVLTGESTAVLKNDAILSENAFLAERKNMVYAGTSVLTGRAKGIVVATGIHTEIGKIADKVANTEEEKSPLTIRMEKFSKQISMLIVVIAVVIGTLLFIKGEDGKVIFLSVIALSVSAMPEGLPLALTMALTIGSNRMLKKNVIVKRLNSVESLGSCTVIASDKTGTLTLNEQTAKKIVLPSGKTYDVTGVGYNDEGSIEGLDETVSSLTLLGTLNNEAILEKAEKGFTYMGDSIDVAFLALARKAKVEQTGISILSRIPYESENQYSAVFYEKKNEVYCTVKGSLEKVLSFSKTMGEGEKLSIATLQQQNDTLAKNGYRVIALASKKIDKKETYTKEDLKDLNFDGMVGFIDPVREEVKGSLKECVSSGIKVVMITGDHPLTAFSIAKELGLATEMPEVATGREIEEALEKGQNSFDEFIKKKKVFSRVTPIQKLEIVNSYKRMGEFVAVTGDGVNDAPALKASNIGIAMGSGTDVAKETAKMIIIDDNFKSIVAGIKEGRNAYSNIRKISYMLLSCGLAEVLFFVLSILSDMPMPLVAIQLLWLNVVTDGLQDFALSFEKAEDKIMKEKPRKTNESLFNRTLLLEVGVSGLTIGLLVFICWYYLLRVLHFEVGVARGYVMALMVFIQNIHVLNCRSETVSAFKVPLKNNPLLIFVIIGSILLQITVMEVDIFSKVLQTVSIPVSHLLILLCLAFSILLVMQLYKKAKKS